MKIERILCPIDFSEASSHAIDQAVVLARWYKARIAVLHVFSPALPAERDAAMPGGESVGNTDLEHLPPETAARLGEARAAGIGVDVFTDVGQPASRILIRAAALPADVIVMGTHGMSGFDRLILGSVTEKVLRKANCAVLTVPPRAHATSRLPFMRILCAVDFSDASIKALGYACSLAQEGDAELTLLHVLEWPWEEPPPPMLEKLPLEQGLALGEFRRYCDEMAMTRLESIVPSNVRTSRLPGLRLRNGKPYVQILRVAEEEGSDLIVIGVGGRTLLNLAVFGSTANQVVRQATCPVLTDRQ